MEQVRINNLRGYPGVSCFEASVTGDKMTHIWLDPRIVSAPPALVATIEKNFAAAYLIGCGLPAEHVERMLRHLGLIGGIILLPN